MKCIKIKTQFVDFHRWPKAPEAVKFLRNLHRHIFYVVVKIQVWDDDRELEYFTIKELVDKIIKEDIIIMNEAKSCEMMAATMLDLIEAFLPDRFISVEVNEDNENGSILDNKN